MRTIEERLDPDIRAALQGSPFGPINAENLAVTRATRYGSVDVASLSDRVDRRTLMVPGPADQPDVAIRVHRPANVDGPLPCIVWMHGGGMIMGNSIQDDPRFDRWCARHQMMAVSIEYRLAPEDPYPAPMEDCYAGLIAVYDRADELGIDRQRIGIGGASAGGGLAAGLALLTRDRPHRDLTLHSQLLIYPMLDDRRITASSKWDVPIWPPASNEFGWSSYVGANAGGPEGSVPIYAAPARANDLHSLPQALIVVGTLDGFVDEDIEYAARLNRAGVDVELHVYPGAPHGFDALLAGTSVSKRCSTDINAWIARVYGT